MTEQLGPRLKKTVQRPSSLKPSRVQILQAHTVCVVHILKTFMGPDSVCWTLQEVRRFYGRPVSGAGDPSEGREGQKGEEHGNEHGISTRSFLRMSHHFSI